MRYYQGGNINGDYNFRWTRYPVEVSLGIPKIPWVNQ
jgi:hypothetical protein